MPIDLATAQAIATAYTAAWNSGDPQAVASHYAATGRIVISNGIPWEGRAGIAAMASGFYADVPDLRLTCDGVRVAGAHVVLSVDLCRAPFGDGRTPCGSWGGRSGTWTRRARCWRRAGGMTGRITRGRSGEGDGVVVVTGCAMLYTFEHRNTPCPPAPR